FLQKGWWCGRKSRERGPLAREGRADRALPGRCRRPLEALLRTLRATALQRRLRAPGAALRSAGRASRRRRRRGDLSARRPPERAREVDRSALPARDAVL